MVGKDDDHEEGRGMYLNDFQCAFLSMNGLSTLSGHAIYYLDAAGKRGGSKIAESGNFES